MYLEVVAKSRQVPSQSQMEPSVVRAKLEVQVRRRVCGAARPQVLLVHCARVIVERLVVLDVFVQLTV